MTCPNAHCHLDGYTLVIHTCGNHGGFSAVLYEHVRGVSVDEQPIVAETADGNLFGPHEFYDNVHDLLAEALRKLCDID